MISRKYIMRRFLAESAEKRRIRFYAAGAGSWSERLGWKSRWGVSSDFEEQKMHYQTAKTPKFNSFDNPNN